jgi:hypothetical protein
LYFFLSDIQQKWNTLQLLFDPTISPLNSLTNLLSHWRRFTSTKLATCLTLKGLTSTTCLSESLALISPGGRDWAAL